MSVKPIPDGYHTVTPYLICKNASAAIDFYKKAFNAEELMRMPMPSGGIGHAEIRIGDSNLMMSDEHPKMGINGPGPTGSPVMIVLYVRDCNLIFDQAVKAGATVVRPLTDQFYGDRSGTLKDPFGHVWTISTHVEDVSDEEIQKRMAAHPECSGT